MLAGGKAYQSKQEYVERRRVMNANGYWLLALAVCVACTAIFWVLEGRVGFLSSFYIFIFKMEIVSLLSSGATIFFWVSWILFGQGADISQLLGLISGLIGLAFLVLVVVNGFDAALDFSSSLRCYLFFRQRRVG